MTTSIPSRCPCGSHRPLGDCCGRFHAGTPAPTPEALMRSRYSAFALGLREYLRDTWHPGTRPSTLDLDPETCWVHLEILDHGKAGERGHVHFRATFREGRHWGMLEEKSSFLHEAGRWYYLNGMPEISRIKPGRNAPCPCGSGRKFKSCCAPA